MPLNVGDLRGTITFEDKFSAAVNRFDQAVGRVGQTTQQTSQKISQMSTIAGGILGASAIARVGSAIMEAGKSAFMAAFQFEQTQMAFTTLLGSGQQAEIFLKDLAQFAAQTPFEFNELTGASRRLLAMGFTAQEVRPMLTAVGDAAAGLGMGSEGIQRITLALGQMNAKGKVSGEEMRQLAEAGIKGWDAIAEKIGTSIPEAMKKAESGAISAKVGIAAIVEGMNKQFAGMMEKQSHTILGMWSTIKDEFATMSREIGTAFLPVGKQIVDGFMGALPAVKELGLLIADVAKAVIDIGGDLLEFAKVVGGTLVDAAGGLASAIKTVTGGMVDFKTALDNSNQAGAAVRLTWLSMQKIAIDLSIAMAKASMAMPWTSKEAKAGYAEDLKMLEAERLALSDRANLIITGEGATRNATAAVTAFNRVVYEGTIGAIKNTGVRKEATAALDKLAAASKVSEQVQREVNAAQIAFNASSNPQTLKNLEEAHNKLSPALKATADAQKNFDDIIKKGAEAETAAAARSAKAAKEAEKLRKEWQKLVDSYRELTAAFQETEAAQNLKAALEVLGPLAKANGDDVLMVAAKLEKLGPAGAQAAEKLIVAWQKANGVLLQTGGTAMTVGSTLGGMFGGMFAFGEQVNQQFTLFGKGASEKFQAEMYEMREKARLILFQLFDPNSPVLAQAAKFFEMVGIELPKGIAKGADKVPSALSGALKDLPGTIIGALQGGGGVGKSVGALFGSALGKDLQKPITGALGKVFGDSAVGKKIAGSLGSLIPGIGAALGPLMGELGSKLIGKLFGGEEKQVNDMRDQFLAQFGGWENLAKQLAEAGDNTAMKRIFDADTVKEYNQAVEAATSVLQKHADEVQLLADANNAVDEAMKRYGLTIEEMGPKFQAQKLMEQAQQLYQDFTLLTKTGGDINAVIEKMGPAMSKFLDTALATGQAIPEAMRPMIDQFFEAGKLLHEDGTAFTEAEKDGLKFSKTLDEQFEELIKKIDKFINALMGIGDVTVPTVQVPVEPVFGGPAGGAGGNFHVEVTPFEYGGIVTKPTLALVGENGPEAIVPLRRGRLQPRQRDTGAAVVSGSPDVYVNIGGEKLDGILVRRQRAGLLRYPPLRKVV